MFFLMPSTVLASTNSHFTEVERLIKLVLLLKKCKFLLEDVPAGGVAPDYFKDPFQP